MNKCELCAHYGACKSLYEILMDGRELPDHEECEHFKDRSRFVELPCKELCEKQGDDIYIIDDGEVVDALLYAVGFDQTMKDVIESASDEGDGELKYHKHRFYDVGKTVFLTREEAEDELARRTANG